MEDIEEMADFLATTIQHLAKTISALPYAPIHIGGAYPFTYRPSVRLACGSYTQECYAISCVEFAESVERTRDAYAVAYARWFPGLPAHDEYSVLYGIAGHLVRLQCHVHLRPRLFTGKETLHHPIMPVAQFFATSRAVVCAMPETAFYEADASVIEVILAHEFLLASSAGRNLHEDDVCGILTAEPPP